MADNNDLLDFMRFMQRKVHDSTHDPESEAHKNELNLHITSTKEQGNALI